MVFPVTLKRPTKGTSKNKNRIKYVVTNLWNNTSFMRIKNNTFRTPSRAPDRKISAAADEEAPRPLVFSDTGKRPVSTALKTPLERKIYT